MGCVVGSRKGGCNGESDEDDGAFEGVLRSTGSPFDSCSVDRSFHFASIMCE